MIDTLIKELDTEMTEAETNEKLNQEDYEEMMADSAAKRATDSKSVAQREGAKADTCPWCIDAGEARHRQSRTRAMPQRLGAGRQGHDPAPAKKAMK